MRIIVFIISLLVLIGCNRSYDTINPTEKKIDSLIQQMTLREKAGQMLNIGIPTVLTGDYWDQRDSLEFDEEKFKRFIVDLNVGSIHNTPGFLPSNSDWYTLIKKVQDAAMNESRLGIPVLYGIDNIHGANYIGGSVMFPHQLAMAATWNPELSRISGAITSYESRSASLPWNFNPNVDVAPNPLWGRISESYGEDPYLITQMANAYIKGSQEKGLDHGESTAVCLKHYLGYGAGNNGKDRANAIIPEINIRQYFLPPFKSAIENGAMGVMISSNAINGIPCHINEYYITEVLKEELGFQGVVISDFSDVEFLVGAHQVAGDMREATKLAVNAGLDLMMNPYDDKIVDHIVDLVENNEIPLSRIDDAVRRNLRLKFALNLFEKPYHQPEEFDQFGSEGHIEANYHAASEAITLLKNENNTLPLSTDKRVFVTGYASNSMNLLNGAWSRTFLGQETKYNDPGKLTILEAIRAEIGTENVTFNEGTAYTEDINSAETVENAKKSDVIVVCVGELPATEKPSDINELELPEVQQELVKELSQLNKPIILVMVQGRPRIIREIEPMVDAVLMAYYPGQEGGRAISDVLFGKVNPSGKLPYTYPKYAGNALTYYHKKTDIRDINWGFDGFYPQYEFGYGLSYTSFEYSNMNISNDTIQMNDTVEISITVKNTGSRIGKEVVQLFVKDEIASVAPDMKRLIRFEKVELEPGYSKQVDFQINKEDLGFINAKHEFIVEPGNFEFSTGIANKETLKAKLHLKK